MTHCCVTLAYLMHVKTFLGKLICVCLRIAAWVFVTVLLSAAQAGGKTTVSLGFVLEQL